MTQSKLNRALSIPYSIQIDHVKDEDGGGFMAFMPDLGLDTCSGCGDSPEKALRRLKKVKQEVFKYLIKRRGGFVFPDPTPAAYILDRESNCIWNKLDQLAALETK